MPCEDLDYYKVLGVARDADAETIKHAFKELARKYHPDVNKAPDAADRFKQAAEAYSVLSDPQKRAAYDSRGFAGVAGFSPEELFGGLDLGDHFSGLGGGLFEHFFGGRRDHSPDEQWRQVELDVPLETIMTGGRETVTLTGTEQCADCHGSGAAPGTEPRTCAECGGRGQKTSAHQEGQTTVQQITTCPVCHGRGRVIDKPCPKCAGQGVTETRQPITIDIPRGIDEGGVLRVPLTGVSLPGNATPLHELHVIVRTYPHRRFRRRGADLWCEETVSDVDAVLGTILPVKTLDGEVEVTVPASTQPDAVLRLRGQGLPVQEGNRRGDLYVTLRVQLPEKLTREEQRLYERLREARKNDR